MLVRSIAVGVALLSTPLFSLAQTTEPETPRYYIGVSAFTNFSQRLSRELDKSTVPPLQLTLGYQLNPRWAVQLGAAYSSSPGSYAGTLHDIYGNPIGNYRNDYRNTALTVTALGRYTLTRTLSHRFQVDALGGFTWDHETYQGKGYNPDYVTTSGTVPFERSSQTNHKALSLGPSFRYRIISGLEAVAEGTVNMDLRSPRVVTTSGAVGLRYRFGR
ncbi:outer membrane beta-barrel protein [Hymenobacter fodinae]|uniref:Outer membrane protein beta-barrel domain-containing protein n=1 Tax=Hymenobacter fodinae TaxID=2510796 RepID=A0A4Z0PAQ7_9BACT|nr:outer membrane beta-barrel protein [Hymenobacter fodinae]TGE09348.1 hypothetical protein EU556_00500 [Hymenobacter fodinae]